jgi:hypothetical protein
MKKILCLSIVLLCLVCSLAHAQVQIDWASMVSTTTITLRTRPNRWCEMHLSRRGRPSVGYATQ